MEPTIQDTPKPKKPKLGEKLGYDPALNPADSYSQTEPEYPPEENQSQIPSEAFQLKHARQLIEKLNDEIKELTYLVEHHKNDADFYAKAIARMIGLDLTP